ncbi:MAG: GatB/YqeY domain-containing protein [Bacteroidetes bacterium]|nr:GatB/YqeY domain-containing protein [Bacteroidota bacterium]
MSLTEKINKALTEAMKNKDEAAKRGLRAIKAELLLLKTKEGAGEISESDEISALARMAKQRRDSIQIFSDQNRNDLAQKEEEELSIIESFLPKQLSSDELEAAVRNIINEMGASGMAAMGKVMGTANSQLKGQADGKAIADVVKKLLTGA